MDLNTLTPAHRACVIYRLHCKANSMNIPAAVEAGMTPKAALIDGQEYLGHCRNSSSGVWRADKERFEIQRQKWGAIITESLPHPEDDDGRDIFVPVGLSTSVVG